MFRHIMAISYCNNYKDANTLNMETPKGNTIGKHLLIECYGKQSCMDAPSLENLMTQAAQTAGATVLSSHFHGFGEGMGYTGVLVLAESHITVHTWPENNYAAFDVFMCGDCQPRLAAELIVQADPEALSDVREIERGGPAPGGHYQPIKATAEAS